MIGITSFGIHVPIYRLSRDEIARAWKTRGLRGEKAVARYDEDTLTMAASAVLDCMKQDPGAPGALFFGSTTPPYREKQVAAVIAGIADLPAETRTADFTGSLRSGTIALGSALDAIRGGSASKVLVAASDSRMGAGKSQFEQQVGDGAVALSLGESGVVAAVEGEYSLYSDLLDTWRTQRAAFVQSWEERFIITQGFVDAMGKTIRGIMKRHELSASDLAKVVFYAPDKRSHADLARGLGFDASQVQDPLFDSIGNTGAAAVPMMFVSALCDARSGDRILVANYGDGGDAFIFRVTGEIARMEERKDEVRKGLSRKLYIDYERYLTWRDLVPLDQPRRPDLRAPSVSCMWRERKSVLALYGSRCRQCGTVQYPPQRVCATCRAKDDFEDYRLSGRKGQIFTYAVDYLTSAVEQPAVLGVVDFDGGGRMACEVTECEPSDIRIGMPVEMSPRKVGRGDNLYNYFWKARPAL